MARPVARRFLKRASDPSGALAKEGRRDTEEKESPWVHHQRQKQISNKRRARFPHNGALFFVVTESSTNHIIDKAYLAD
jgi:hypothetical protein